MAENSEKKSSNKVIIVLVVLLILLLGIILFFIIDSRRDNVESDDPAEVVASLGFIPYEGEGVVVLDEEALKEVMKADEGSIALNYERNAYSVDGEHFDCVLNNSPNNNYDIYLNIYLDNNCTEQVLLTGLIPPGSGIREFKSDIKLKPGQYETVLVFTQIKDDHKTICGQVKVTYTLWVDEQ